jgi:DNA-binding NarL/FixJ family response regulator
MSSDIARIRILTVDDHPIVREEIAGLIAMQAAGDKVESYPISFPSEQGYGLLVVVDEHQSWGSHPTVVP